MISREALNGAVSAGIVTAEQADKLVSYLALQGQNIEALEQAERTRHDPEEVRFTKGFHDIFISVGLLILAAGYIIGLGPVVEDNSIVSAVAAALGGAIVWGLAEWFTKIKKLALPSILLTGMFGVAVAATGAFLVPENSAYGELNPVQVIVASVAALIGAGVFYRRFKVPITLTVILAGVMGLAVGLMAYQSVYSVMNNITWITLGAGLFTFACAMYFDAKDVYRETLNTDKAFWLHLLAAPLIVHSILNSAYFEKLTEGDALLSIGIVALFGAIALIIDRRAMLVAALSYLGFALAYLLESTDLSASQLTAISLVLLGCFVLLLGSGWNVARRIVMRPLAGSFLTTYLPPIRN